MRRTVPLLVAAALLVPAAPSVAAPFKVSLKTPKSQPKAGKLWPITVKVRSNSGRKLHAVAWYQFLFNGQPVGGVQYPDPKSHGVGHRHKPYPFYGQYSDVLLFPARSVGIPLTFRVQVRVKGKGTVHRDRAIRVRK